MDIRIIFNEKDGFIDGHLHHAKSITLLCDCGCDKILIENTDGSFESYDVDIDNRIVRIEEIK